MKEDCADKESSFIAPLRFLSLRPLDVEPQANTVRSLMPVSMLSGTPVLSHIEYKNEQGPTRGADSSYSQALLTYEVLMTEAQSSSRIDQRLFSFVESTVSGNLVCDRQCNGVEGVSDLTLQSGGASVSGTYRTPMSFFFSIVPSSRLSITQIYCFCPADTGMNILQTAIVPIR